MSYVISNFDGERLIRDEYGVFVRGVPHYDLEILKEVGDRMLIRHRGGNGKWVGFVVGESFVAELRDGCLEILAVSRAHDAHILWRYLHKQEETNEDAITQ